MLTDEEIQKMIEIAKATREKAFAPKKTRTVGACILTQDGEFFGGCSIDCFISGLGICSERAAVDHAVIHGKYIFKGIAVYDEKLNYPCGMCLQYLFPFYQITNQEIEIIVADAQGTIMKTTLHELLPHGYETSSDLDKVQAFRNRS